MHKGESIFEIIVSEQKEEKRKLRQFFGLESCFNAERRQQDLGYPSFLENFKKITLLFF